MDNSAVSVSASETSDGRMPTAHTERASYSSKNTGMSSEESATNPTQENPSTNQIWWISIVVIGAAVVVIGIIIILLCICKLKKKKKKNCEESSETPRRFADIQARGERMEIMGLVSDQSRSSSSSSTSLPR